MAPTLCSKCNQSFPNQNAKKKHYRETHQDTVEVTFKDGVKRRVARRGGVFTCSCGYSHQNSNNFNGHGRAHPAPPPASPEPAQEEVPLAVGPPPAALPNPPSDPELHLPDPPAPQDLPGIINSDDEDDGMPPKLSNAPFLPPPRQPDEVTIQTALQPPPQSSAVSPHNISAPQSQAEPEGVASSQKKRKIGEVIDVEAEIETPLLSSPKPYNINPLFLPPIWALWGDYDVDLVRKISVMTDAELAKDPPHFGKLRQIAARFFQQAVKYTQEAPPMFLQKLLTSVGSVSKDMLVIGNVAAAEEMFVRYIMFLFRTFEEDLDLDDLILCRVETSYRLWELRNAILASLQSTDEEKLFSLVATIASQGFSSYVVKSSDYQTSCLLNFVNLAAWKGDGFVDHEELLDLLSTVDVMARVVVAEATLLQYGDGIKNGTAPIMTGRPDEREYQIYETLSTDAAFAISALSRSLHLLKLVSPVQDKPAAKPLRLGDLRETYLASVEELQKNIDFMSFGIDLPIDLDLLQDDVTNQVVGYSFITDALNGFDMDFLKKGVLKDQELHAKLSGEDFHDAYMRYYSRTLEVVAVMLAICCGEMFEPEDLCRLSVENGGGYSRSFFIHGGHMFVALRAVGTEIVRVQILPKDVGTMLAKVMVYVFPFVQYLQEMVPKSPLEWAHPLIPRPFFTIRTRVIPGTSIDTIVRSATKDDLTADVLRNSVIELKLKRQVDPRPQLYRRLDLVSRSLEIPATVAVEDLLRAQKDLSWLRYFLGEDATQYKASDKRHIRRLIISVKATTYPLKSILSEVKNLNSKSRKGCKGVFLVRSAPAVQMMLDLAPNIGLYHLTNVETEGNTIEAWLQDPQKNAMVLTFGQFDTLMTKIPRDEIGWIIHATNCGDINTVLSHCLIAKRGFGIHTYVNRHSGVAKYAMSKDQLMMNEWLWYNCAKKVLYWQMGFEGGNCYEEGDRKKCSYCDAFGEFEEMKKMLVKISTTKTCGFCVLHRQSATQHTSTEGVCQYQKSAPFIATLTRSVKFRSSFVEGCCHTCGMPASWCPEKECVYKGVPVLLCAAAIADEDIRKHLEHLSVEYGRKAADFLLQGGERNGMLMVLDTLFKKGFLLLP
ncbi:hypothetical protein AA313_de0203638 [Arthrobotrys entomopaga]|nr:hypothetical protein AA313_de0203638 [Arthrobotrys entomopaga]